MMTGDTLGIGGRVSVSFDFESVFLPSSSGRSLDWEWTHFFSPLSFMAHYG